MSKKLTFFMLFLIVGIGMVVAQNTKVLSGTVTSGEDGQPVIGASVVVKGTTVGTVTDFDGKFNLRVPSNAKVCVISYVGMNSQEVAIKPNLAIVLQASTQNLDEVVVTAQGLSRKEKSLGYSTTKISAEKLTVARQTDLGQSLAGKVSGARFFSASGATFDSGTIVLRGTTSYTSTAGSEPIYVVDGSITNKSAVNMDDVESVNVLKGPAATSLYGYQGANGAVIITTKKAKEGKGTIEVSHTMTFEKFYNHFKLQKEYGGGSGGLYGEYYDTKYGSKYDTMGADFIYDMAGVGGKNEDGSYFMDYNSDECWGARFDPNIQMASALYYDPTSSKYQKADPYVNRLNLSDLYHTGVNNTTNVAFAKAGQDYNIRVSFTNSDRTGIQYNSSAVRRYLGFKSAFKPAKWLNVSLDYKYTYRRDHNGAEEGYPGEGYGSKRNVLYDFVQWGQSNVNIKDYKDYMRADGSWRTWNIISTDNLAANFHDNPFAIQKEINNVGTYQWNVFTGDAEAILPYNFKAGMRVIGNIRNYNGDSKYPEGSINFISKYSLSQDWVRDMTYQGRLTWGNHYFDNRLSADAAAFVEERIYNYGTMSSGTALGLSIPEWYNLNASKSYVSATNSETHYKTRSIFGTATLGWDDTYYLDGSLRQDWSSTLPTAHNGYLYGGLSASVLLHKFVHPSWLDFWKLRASAAQVGSTLGAYATNYVYSTSTKYGSKMTLALPNSQLNPNIKPTISTSYEVGTEFRMLKNRVWGDFNIYRRDTKNQIMYVPVASVTGYAYKQMNAGLVRNQGIELSLGGAPVKTKDFEWDVDANIAKNQNKLVKLGGDITEFMLEGNSFYAYWYVKSIVGKPMGELTTMGHINVNDKGLPILYKTTSGYWGGGYKLNWTKGQEEYVGNFQPKWTGGFSTNLRYKNVRLAASFDYSIGGKVVNWTNMWATGSGTSAKTSYNNDKGVNVREGLSKGGGVKVHGVLEDGTETDVYMNAYQYFHYIANYDLNRWVVSRTYVKMRELSLNYSIPQDFLAKAKIGITAANVSFVATNPWLIYSAIPNVDPSESSTNWLEGGQAPSTRTFGFTVNLTF